eukprot:9893333-Prorocentrum_lima.AAC.1
MQPSTVRIPNPESVAYPDVERRRRPRFIQVVPEGLRRTLLIRNTISCAEILLDGADGGHCAGQYG